MSYAWLMVAVTFATQFLCMGAAFYSFSVVLKPLAEEFGGGRFGVTLLPLALSASGAVIAPLVGRWIVKGSIRNIMVLGCVSTGVGFLLASRATALWQIGLLFGSLLCFGVATMAGVTAQALVVNWFDRNRTMALGVSLMGVSLSGMVMAHVATMLVADGGWRWAFEVFGWMILAVTPIVGWLVVGRPEERGRATVDFEAQPSASSAALSTRDALRQPTLWIIAVVSGLAFMGTSAILTHVIPFGTDAGFSAAQSAWILSVLAGGAAAGKIVFGWLARRISERAALFVSLGMQAIGILGLTVDLSFAPLLALCVFLGTAIGGVMPLVVALLARAFGPDSFGPMMGLMTPILIPFQSSGAPYAGWIFDTTGSYDIAWWTFVGIIGVAAALLSRLRTDAVSTAS